MSQFTEVIPRRGTRSVKWDMAEELYQDKDVLPMWVADMDFKTPQAVTEALQERVSHGIFGYTVADHLFRDYIVSWLERRHDWKVDGDWISYSPGVIPSLHMIIQALTEKADAILIQTPVYPPFYSVVNEHERTLVKNQLKLENDQYRIDFEDFEQKIIEHEVKVFILCNPHNPVGRVWTKEELMKMGDICVKHNVKIIADEIHADLVFKPNKHIPIASLSEEMKKMTITCLSPTKTFNLAGLQVSYLVTPDKSLREPVMNQFKQQGIHMLNTLGITALEAAYKDGDDWLEELLDTLEAHRDYVTERFEKETKSIRILPAEGTYLLWMDCRKLGFTQAELKKFMQKNAKVGLNDGASFGEEGNGFMRLNIAAPKDLIVEGTNRIINAVKEIE
ncbi:pyridoxal phosphate-dependent aminotransferase [Halobacillus salinarum]|uniref:cysteine-S-conjugate beta-lyase n=2 Tax=Halobacillus salinarum TaxID=2932257 RepID=A0ABY4ERB6_9BACI|nr:pyridoxal phosphate-dependent aminotransferase [Halobacillus salinarum]